MTRLVNMSIASRALPACCRRRSNKLPIAERAKLHNELRRGASTGSPAAALQDLAERSLAREEESGEQTVRTGALTELLWQALGQVDAKTAQTRRRALRCWQDNAARLDCRRKPLEPRRGAGRQRAHDRGRGADCEELAGGTTSGPSRCPPPSRVLRRDWHARSTRRRSDSTHCTGGSRRRRL